MPPPIADALAMLLAQAIAADAPARLPASARATTPFSGEGRPECVRARAIGWDCCARLSARQPISPSLPLAQRLRRVEPLPERRHP